MRSFSVGKSAFPASGLHAEPEWKFGKLLCISRAYDTIETEYGRLPL